MTPTSLSLEPLNVTIYGKRDFHDVIKLRILRWKDDPARVLIKEGGKRVNKEGHVVTQLEVGVTFFGYGGWDQESRNAGNLHNLEKTRKQNLPYILQRKHSPANTLVSAQ